MGTTPCKHAKGDVVVCPDCLALQVETPEQMKQSRRKDRQEYKRKLKDEKHQKWLHKIGATGDPLEDGFSLGQTFGHPITYISCKVCDKLYETKVLYSADAALRYFRGVAAVHRRQCKRGGQGKCNDGL